MFAKYTAFLEPHPDPDVAEARKWEPEASWCGWCGAVNDFADDCGWFYIHPHPLTHPDPSKPCCESCYRGPLGRSHTSRYGIGER